MKREYVTNGLLLVAATAVGIICLKMVAPFLIAITWAAVLAIVIFPIHKRLVSLLRNTSVAALLSCFIALIIGILPLVFVGFILTKAVLGYLGSHSAEGSASLESIVGWINAEATIGIDWLDEHLGVGRLDPNTLRDSAKQAGAFLVGQTQQFLGGVAGFFFNLVIVVFTLFFFLRDHERVLGTIRSFLPLSDENTDAVFKRVLDAVNASVLGGGAVAVAQGVLTILGFWAVGIPNPLLWGVVTAFCSFIPFVGAAAVWVPGTLVLIAQGRLGAALGLALWGALAISMVDNFIRPILVGDRTQLPTAVIFFSIMGGLQVFGFLGIIMGPVVLTVGLALVEIFRREILERQEEERRKTGQLSPPPGATVIVVDDVSP